MGPSPGRAVPERRTVTVGDVTQDPRYVAMLGSAIRSEIAVPITLAADRVSSACSSGEPGTRRVQRLQRGRDETSPTKVRSLLAFAKLRNDVTAALESRHVNDLLIAIGDQTSNFIHRLNNSAGALRAGILAVQEIRRRRRA